MKIPALLLLCLLIFHLPASAADEQKSWGFYPLPVVARSPETGLMLGIASVLWDTAGNSQAVRQNLLMFEAVYTTRNQLALRLGIDRFLLADKYRLEPSSPTAGSRTCFSASDRRPTLRRTTPLSSSTPGGASAGRWPSISTWARPGISSTVKLRRRKRAVCWQRARFREAKASGTPGAAPGWSWTAGTAPSLPAGGST